MLLPPLVWASCKRKEGPPADMPSCTRSGHGLAVPPAAPAAASAQQQRENGMVAEVCVGSGAGCASESDDDYYLQLLDQLDQQGRQDL
jgi:hypothetical protein